MERNIVKKCRTISIVLLALTYAVGPGPAKANERTDRIREYRILSDRVNRCFDRIETPTETVAWANDSESFVLGESVYFLFKSGEHYGNEILSDSYGGLGLEPADKMRSFEILQSHLLNPKSGANRPVRLIRMDSANHIFEYNVRNLNRFKDYYTKIVGEEVDGINGALVERQHTQVYLDRVIYFKYQTGMGILRTGALITPVRTGYPSYYSPVIYKSSADHAAWNAVWFNLDADRGQEVIASDFDDAPVIQIQRELKSAELTELIAKLLDKKYSNKEKRSSATVQQLKECVYLAKGKTLAWMKAKIAESN